ncbi:hypothetical protein BDZ89DRAFT_1138685 [Hymenopellis radicata]|nr:hypothetical protein BDZ89DRAFT_1138685 [Hymenopellis radicata]
MQSCICDEFLKRFAERTKNIKVGDPFAESGKEHRATVHLDGTEGYFVSPQVDDTVYDLVAAGVNCAKQLYFWRE